MTVRPVTTLDFDGVICRPILGWNVGISREFLDPEAAPRPASVPPRWFSRPADYLRFNFRRPLPGVARALEELHDIREVVILTGRRTDPGPWLRRHGLEGSIDRIVVNSTELRSAHFKLHMVRQLEAAEHLDDDGRTVQLLAQRSPTRIYLRDWPRNRGLPFTAGVTRVADLADFVRRLGAQTADASRASERNVS
ncbi:MAG: hypothetical protein K1X87_01245 [Dehalococcoidia bacterium]|nr:hypothetical protein [Dehalococcoidia bacterium]